MAWCLENTPDIIFVNLALPEKSAFSLLQNLRANDATNAVPVIGLSVKTALEQQSAALQAGFACVVTKPTSGVVTSKATAPTKATPGVPAKT